MNLSTSRSVSLGDCFEHGNELSGSIKFGAFLNYLINYSLYVTGPWSEFLRAIPTAASSAMNCNSLPAFSDSASGAEYAPDRGSSRDG